MTANAFAAPRSLSVKSFSTSSSSVSNETRRRDNNKRPFYDVDVSSIDVRDHFATPAREKNAARPMTPVKLPRIDRSTTVNQNDKSTLELIPILGEFDNRVDACTPERLMFPFPMEPTIVIRESPEDCNNACDNYANNVTATKIMLR